MKAQGNICILGGLIVILLLRFTIDQPVRSDQTMPGGAIELFGHIGGLSTAVDIRDGYAFVGIGAELAVRRR